LKKKRKMARKKKTQLQHANSQFGHGYGHGHGFGNGQEERSLNDDTDGAEGTDKEAEVATTGAGTGTGAGGTEPTELPSSLKQKVEYPANLYLEQIGTRKKKSGKLFLSDYVFDTTQDKNPIVLPPFARIPVSSSFFFLLTLFKETPSMDWTTPCESLDYGSSCFYNCLRLADVVATKIGNSNAANGDGTSEESESESEQGSEEPTRARVCILLLPFFLCHLPSLLTVSFRSQKDQIGCHGKRRSNTNT
jgi:hypothetical protein